jgi:hypothetical protein
MIDRQDPEEELRGAFETLRGGRDRSAGYFHEVLAAGRERLRVRRAATRRRYALALLASLPVAALLTVRVREQSSEREALMLAREAAQIAEWRSPTDALLSSPYDQLMREIPSLQTSVLDAGAQPSGGSR